ncbi:paired immunoglobulin-like type 2 receptor beta-2 [Neovison vison]|uniref:paired immunoglobulin-like type 2 receptor beta-2 n=1 Tax=Neovison vison TaxID=452646 RepID=UPI001CEFEA5B|nr:paired immunoglobulin-like type 2 receptor beta-2 [Neogale vison]
MGPFLVLSLLLLPSRLQAGRSAECVTNTNYGIKQPDRLSAPQGGSVRIPFSFYQDLELAKDPRVSVALRQTHFHGEIIYNSTRRFIRNDYKNRISLELSLGQRSGSLQISNLQEKDGNMYFCRIQVETLRCGKKVWQAINGTKLTITPALEMTTTAPTTAAPTSGVLEGNWSSAPSPMGVGPMVIVTLADIVLKIAILGLILYLRWKRSKG